MSEDHTNLFFVMPLDLNLYPNCIPLMPTADTQSKDDGSNSKPLVLLVVTKWHDS